MTNTNFIEQAQRAWKAFEGAREAKRAADGAAQKADNKYGVTALALGVVLLKVRAEEGTKITEWVTEHIGAGKKIWDSCCHCIRVAEEKHPELTRASLAEKRVEEKKAALDQKVEEKKAEVADVKSNPEADKKKIEAIKAEIKRAEEKAAALRTKQEQKDAARKAADAANAAKKSLREARKEFVESIADFAGQLFDALHDGNIKQAQSLVGSITLAAQSEVKHFELAPEQKKPVRKAFSKTFREKGVNTEIAARQQAAAEKAEKSA